MAVNQRVLHALPGFRRDGPWRGVAGSWGATRHVVVGTDAGEVVVKEWVGELAVARGVAEMTLLDRLATKAFGSVPRPIALDGEAVLYEAGEERAWTAQTFLPGPNPDEKALGDRGFIRSAASLLAGFHRATATRPTEARTSRSRLLELRALPELASHLSAPESRLVRWAYRFVAPLLTGSFSLPRCQVHGDVNLENLIITSTGPALIDFEFTRTDSRALDIAALAAPLRNAGGTLLPAPDIFLAEFVQAYLLESSDSDTGLEVDERDLLPLLSLAHFLLVLTDQLKAGSANTRHVLPVIPRLLSHAMAVGKRSIAS